MSTPTISKYSRAERGAGFSTGSSEPTVSSGKRRRRRNRNVESNEAAGDSGDSRLATSCMQDLPFEAQATLVGVSRSPFAGLPKDSVAFGTSAIFF